jgi:integrase
VFFYRRRCDFHNKWDAVIKAAGIKRMTPHSGRHGFATTALKKMAPKTAAWLGGWKNIRPVHGNLCARDRGHHLERTGVRHGIDTARNTKCKKAPQDWHILN